MMYRATTYHQTTFFVSKAESVSVNLWNQTVTKPMTAKLALILMVLFALGGCSSTRQSEPTAEGNLGAEINSSSDEYAPFRYDKRTLLFSSTNREWQGKRPPMEQASYFSTQSNEGFSSPRFAEEFPLEEFKGSGYPTFAMNPITKQQEMLFAAPSNPGASMPNVDIFYAVKKGATWSKPVALAASVNSAQWDSQPFFSPDGSYFLFSSDRSGGIGGIDIYMVRRTAAGTWSNPINLGDSLNTPNDEFTPSISPDGTLMFASKGYKKKKDFDIIIADGQGQRWSNPRAMPQPLNSPFNDINAAVWDDSILFASDRPGGYGGYDLYRFDLCGPVMISGKVRTPDGIGATGTVTAVDVIGKEYAKTEVQSDGYFRFNVPARQYLIVRYESPCVPGRHEKRITTPCDEASAVALALEFVVEKKDFVFTFEKYDIPFFVSGYYLPNTSENLQALRLKFSYGLLGNDDSTRYVEKPGKEYNSYANAVDSALHDAYTFIAERLNLLDDDICGDDNKELVVTITGFADPRGIYEKARYSGTTIDDEDFNFHLDRGTLMTNETLSALRAYYTAKWLQTKIEQLQSYRKYKNNIVWRTSGNGIDDDDTKNDSAKRRVEITISLSKKQ